MANFLHQVPPIDDDATISWAHSEQTTVSTSTTSALPPVAPTATPYLGQSRDIDQLPFVRSHLLGHRLPHGYALPPRPSLANSDLAPFLLPPIPSDFFEQLPAYSGHDLESGAATAWSGFFPPATPLEPSVYDFLGVLSQPWAVTHPLLGDSNIGDHSQALLAGDFSLPFISYPPSQASDSRPNNSLQPASEQVKPERESTAGEASVIRLSEEDKMPQTRRRRVNAPGRGSNTLARESSASHSIEGTSAGQSSGRTRGLKRRRSPPAPVEEPGSSSGAQSSTSPTTTRAVRDSIDDLFASDTERPDRQPSESGKEDVDVINLADVDEVPEELRPKRNSNMNPLSEFQCIICMDDVKHLTVTHCGHLFCAECLHSSLNIDSTKKVCPICRQRLDVRPASGKYGPKAKGFYALELRLMTKKRSGKRVDHS